mgnify:CR=1 FL=1
MKDSYCIVLTTTNSQESKQALIAAIFNHQLAACIQTMPIEIHYVWQQQLCCDDEILLVIKTTSACYSSLEDLIVKIHNYDVPQVVKLPFTDGFNPYLAWLEQNTRC